MNRRKTMIYGQTANINYLPLLVVIHYLVMYTITEKNKYKRGGKMDKKEDMAKIEKLPVEEKYKLLPITDQAYIRGFIDRSIVEQMKTGPQKPPLPKQKHKKEKQNENR